MSSASEYWRPTANYLSEKFMQNFIQNPLRKRPLEGKIKTDLK
jgi:hypothetical protein